MKLKVKKSILILGIGLIFIQAAALEDYAAAGTKSFDRKPFEETDSKLDLKPPLEPGRIITELLAGLAGAAILGYLGYEMTYQSSGGWMNLSGAGGAIIGFTLGTSIGVLIAGSSGDQMGSFFATLLGTVLGLAAGLPSFLNGGDQYGLNSALLAEVGAIVGFNLSRRYKSGRLVAALVNFQEGKPNFEIPRISMGPSLSRPGTMSISVGLANIEW